jgi:hypothetical protein
MVTRNYIRTKVNLVLTKLYIYDSNIVFVAVNPLTLIKVANSLNLLSIQNFRTLQYMALAMNYFKSLHGRHTGTDSRK